MPKVYLELEICEGEYSDEELEEWDPLGADLGTVEEYFYENDFNWDEVKIKARKVVYEDGTISWRRYE